VPQRRPEWTITVDGVELPVDEDVRHALLDDFRTVVRDRLRERHDVEVDQDDITVATGYRYVQVPEECPLCSEELDLLSVYLNTEYGATQARCVPATTVSGAVTQSIELPTLKAARVMPSRAVS